MSIIIRPAEEKDALGILAVAENRARVAMKEHGATDDHLSSYGFILFPKTLEKYKNRIKVSNHFWVAAQETEENELIIGYRMAYSLDEMGKIPDPDENDSSCHKYYTQDWGADGSTVYLHQSARLLTEKEYRSFADPSRQEEPLLTIPDSQSRFMFDLAGYFISHAKNNGSPGIVCDIAQHPMRNTPSSNFALNTGFTMFGTRKKWDEEITDNRVSGTFLLTLGREFV